MARYFNRYKTLDSDSKHISPPFIKLIEKTTDLFTVYNTGKSRLDKISQQYYSAPYYGWLIMSANPQFGGMEFDIPNGAFIRIPYPLKASIQQYIDAVNNYNSLDGI